MSGGRITRRSLIRGATWQVEEALAATEDEAYALPLARARSELRGCYLRLARAGLQQLERLLPTQVLTPHSFKITPHSTIKARVACGGRQRAGLQWPSSCIV